MTSRFLLNQSLRRRLILASGLIGGSMNLLPRQPAEKKCHSLMSNYSLMQPPSIAACSSLRDLRSGPSTRITTKPTKFRGPRLRSKVAVITGASRGLGQAIAVKFVQEGASVILLDIANCKETLEKISKVVGEDGDIKDAALAIECDISNEEKVKQSIKQACEQFGPRIDVLVNNACAFVFKSVEDATVEDWNTSMQVNILGHCLVTKHCLPYMKHAVDSKPVGFGPSIIFQGSISSFRAQPGCSTYATMKGAIVQLARNCAYDLAKYNIRVNTICPGTVETPISIKERNDHGWTYEEWEALKTQDVFLGRVGLAEEVANAALFFASDESSYCSGSHLMVDGGAAACTVMQKNN